jgi:hypothetical protein
MPPGAAYYDQLKAPRGTEHNAALRQLPNRLVGILHGYLKIPTCYDEASASCRQCHLRGALCCTDSDRRKDAYRVLALPMTLVTGTTGIAAITMLAHRTAAHQLTPQCHRFPPAQPGVNRGRRGRVNQQRVALPTAGKTVLEADAGLSADPPRRLLLGSDAYALVRRPRRPTGGRGEIAGQRRLDRCGRWAVGRHVGRFLPAGPPLPLVRIVGQLRATATDVMRGVGADDATILTQVDEALCLSPV